MKHRPQYALVGLLFCALLLAETLQAQPTHTAQAAPKPDPRRFEKDISAFLTADQTNPPPQKAILFIGSSIFRQWSKLPAQMAPLPVFNRAFGGSLTTDQLYYLDKIVLPYEPRIIVYYCGSNDINAGRNAVEIFDGFRRLVERVHAKLPQTRIYYVSINRAPQKRDKWDVVDAANKQARDYCATNDALGFIDVNPALFNEAGQPRLELYQPDQLHFKKPAYDAFAAIIKPVLAKEWAAQSINLPVPQKTGGMPLMDALAKRSTGREFDSRELSPGQLSSLLWACFGINRPDGKRTAPSAKDCQETDIYVILRQGAYLYDAKSNQLNLIVAEDLRSLASTQAFATNAPVTLVFVADQARMEKSSAEEKRNYAYIDVGYISQNAYLYCASEGLVTGARASVDRKALSLKLKLQPDQKIVLAQSVGYAKP